MENKDIGYKILYSLNMISFLRMRGADVTLDYADDLIYGYVIDDENTNKIIDEYKQNIEIQTFLHTYQSLRNEIKELRKS